jgi:alpha-glucosidase
VVFPGKFMIMKKIGVFVVLILIISVNIYAQEFVYSLGRTELKIKNTFPVLMDLKVDGEWVLKDLKADLKFSEVFPMEMRMPFVEESDTTISFTDPVPLKFSNKKEKYKRIFISVSNKFGFEILLSEKSLNYRWVLNFQSPNKIADELVSFSLNHEDLVYFPKEESMISHYERMYLNRKVEEIESKDFCSLPVLFDKSSGLKLLFTESDLYNYPAMFLEKSGSNTFVSKFPSYILKTQAAERGADRNQIILEEADYISNFAGRRNLAWRNIIIARNDADLLTNTTVYQLSREGVQMDYSWVKPGKVAWDWWNANNITGVDFESGINNQTYQYYIDFASEYGLEYIILDEGWSKSTTNILECQADIDVPDLVKYGKEKNVGIILWTLWGPLNEKMEEVLDLYESWGVKGIKVDFMQRADQEMVEFYERTAREAAKRKLLVDFHGAFKPAGLRRAYPNVVNYEGLKGLENAKWSKLITPKHDLVLPFLRMVAGPMDYTPGAMNNAHEDYFSIRWNRPMSMGTRCHQLAMYVIYEAPLQMLCDAPSHYYKEEESTRFISQIPTCWDETIVFEAAIGSHLLMARKNGKDWYVGGMAVEAMEFELDLSFLAEGKYEIQIMEDGINSNKNAEDYRFLVSEVSQLDKLSIKMNKAGGYAAIIRKK